MAHQGSEADCDADGHDFEPDAHGNIVYTCTDANGIPNGRSHTVPLADHERHTHSVAEPFTEPFADCPACQRLGSLRREPEREPAQA